MWLLMKENNAKLAIFFSKRTWFFLIIENMAVKKLLIPFVYICPFTTHFFKDDTFVSKIVIAVRNANYFFKKLCRY